MDSEKQRKPAIVSPALTRRLETSYGRLLSLELWKAAGELSDEKGVGGSGGGRKSCENEDGF